MKKKNKIILWIIFVFTIAIIVVTMKYDYTRFKTLSSKAQGVVTNVSSTLDGRGKRHYYSEYEFTFNNKKYYGKYSSSVQHSIGDILVIKYDKNEPQINFEQSEDNSMVSSITAFIAVFVLLGELAYIEEKTVNKKRKNVNKDFAAFKKFFKLISSIMLILLVITIIFIIYSKNHDVMLSMKLLVYLSFGMTLTFFTAYCFVNKSISKIENKPQLLNKLKNSKEIKCESTDVYFTNEQIIEIGLRSQIINYSDIVLMSLEKQYRLRSLDSYYILLITKDFKKHKLGIITAKDFSCHEQIMEELRKRIPNIIEGYTQENKEIIKKMKQDKK